MGPVIIIKIKLLRLLAALGLAAALVLFACKPEQVVPETPSEQQDPEDPPVPEVVYGFSKTLEAEQLTPLSAVVKGMVTLGSAPLSDVKVSFQVALSAEAIEEAEELQIQEGEFVLVSGDDGEEEAVYEFEMSLQQLEPETTYYFRATFRQDEEFSCGDTKPFTTKGLSDLIKTLDATSVTATSATLNSSLDLTYIQYESLSYGFEWGSDENALSSSVRGGAITDNSFSASIDDLATDTEYWFRSIVSIDGRIFRSDIKSFRTSVLLVSAIILDYQEYTLYGYESTIQLHATVIPENATIRSVGWSSSDESVATVNADGVVTAYKGGFTTITATSKDGSWRSNICRIYVKGICPNGAVDMGTVITRKDGTRYTVFWADCNLGAGRPDEYGDFYSWGAYEPYYRTLNPLTWKDGKESGYTWETYPLANGAANKLKAYCPEDKPEYWSGTGPVDGLTVLLPESDIAFIKLGGNWRIPTNEEWGALLQVCTTQEVTVNGVSGLRLLSRVTNKQIFLPPGGYFNGVEIALPLRRNGYYWSSTVYEDSPDQAYDVWFGSGSIQQNHYYRFNGRPIRPVSE